MTRRLIAIAGFVTLFGVPLAVAPTPALAYTNGCTNGTTSVTTTSTVVTGTSVNVTATTTDCNGTGGVQGISFTSSDNCVTFDSTNTTSNAQGVASTTANLGPNCPCQVTLTATNTTTGVSGSTTVRKASCLPFTSADAQPAVPAADNRLLVAAIVVAAALVLVLAGLAVQLRRRRA